MQYITEKLRGRKGGGEAVPAELFCREAPTQTVSHATLQPVFPSLMNFRGFGSGLQYISWKTCSGLSAALARIN